MKRFSFGSLLRNDRLMMICSLLLAVGVWYFVISSSSNISTRTITCTLNTANVSNGSLQVVEDKTITVDVVVEGPLSDILQLTQEDIRVQLNTADIQSAGNCRVNVMASRNSQKGGYNIVSTSPKSATLFCDEWVDGQEFFVSASAPLVSAEGDERDIHAVTVEEKDLPGGMLIVQGPRSEVSRIAGLVARVSREESISSKGVFAGEVVALDSDNNDLDLKYCKFLRYAEDPAVNANAALMDISSLNVAVTVKERRQIPFSYKVLNAPSGVDLSKIITIHPSSVIIEGEQELLAEYVERIADLCTVDFDHLSTLERSRSNVVNLPVGLTVIGNDEFVTVLDDGTTDLNVEMKFDWTGYTRRTFTWYIGTDITDSSIDFKNVPTDKKVQMLTNELQVTLFGKTAAVNAVRASDIAATVDMNASSLGTYAVRPQISSPDVWVYYGSTGYTIYVTIEQSK